MSITFIPSGDMRTDPADILVCAVNLAPGVMGAGQAKAFADRWPWLIDHHRRAVKGGDLAIGRGVCVWEDRPTDHAASSGAFGVFLLPTKRDWRKPSQLEWVAEGLGSLVKYVHWANREWAVPGTIKAIACPALGAGLGGLRWADVKTLIEASAGRCPEIEWRVYLPGAERRIAS